MGGIRNAFRWLYWVWRRISDVSTIQWAWPWGATLVTVAAAIMQSVPVALLIVYALGAFAFTLCVVLLWRDVFGKRQSVPQVAAADPDLEWLSRPSALKGALHKGLAGKADPIRDRTSVLNAAMYMVFHDWNHTQEDLTAEDQILFISGNFTQMVQDAADGALDIWVKRQRHGGVHENPGPGYWAEHHLDWVSERGAISARPNGRGHLTQTYDPLVRKSDIERLYGPKRRNGGDENEPGDNWKTV